MYIKNLQLKNFKRFSDLEIDLGGSILPKLVLLIGANGCGKSSIFDAFTWNYQLVKNSSIDQTGYFNKKNQAPECKIVFQDGSIFNRQSDNILEGKNLVLKFYGRASQKIVAQIPSVNFNQDTVTSDSDFSPKFILPDNRFINDLPAYTSALNQALQEPTFRGQSADTRKIYEEYVEPLNKSLRNIFASDIESQLQFVHFKDQISNQPAEFIFQKGDSEINYDLLSHGEKQVFVVLLNLLVRTKLPEYQDKIYYFDETDLHLNTALQYNLLQEIMAWIPADCQFWTASHSLGFIQFAQEYNQGAIIDFDSLNFDEKQHLWPLPKNSSNIFEIAVPKYSLELILKGKKIFFCEGKNDKYYNLLELEDVVFIGGDRRNKDSILFDTKDSDYFGIIDRDYLTDGEIITLKNEYKNIRVLDLYSIESYWYHPENLYEVDPNFNVLEYKKEILECKNQNLLKMEIDNSRHKYLFFKEKEEVLKKGTQDVQTALNSDDFEIFYPYFDIKKYLLEKPKFTIETLTKTQWFKTKIDKLLKN